MIEYLAYVIFVTVSWMMSIYGFNFYYLFFRSLNNRSGKMLVLNGGSDGNSHDYGALDIGTRGMAPNHGYPDAPYITIQLPIYNEKYVAERLIRAVCRMDYPRDRMQIQVLDDSTDETKEICAELVEYYRAKGYRIEHVVRRSRAGYKAGALREGLKSADGEFIAIFDADFIPPPWFLKRVMPYFADERIGLVQCKWGHINEDYSTLTQAQALSLDFHFTVEQKAKSLTHLFMNFNGTAGVWRRRCIDDSGGWHVGTLVEDLDLSYRAQMRGWKCLYLDEVVVDAELPVQINAAKRQQYRWAKGSIQCAIKLLDKIILSRHLSLDTKIQAFIQLTRHIVHPLLLTQFLLLPLLLAMNYNIYPIQSAPLSPLVAYVLLGPVFYMYVMKKLWPDRWLSRIKAYFFLILFFTGISVSNTIAVFDALLGSRSEFHRTPKFGIVRKGEDWRGKDYVLPFTRTTLLEIFFAGYGIVGIFISIFNGNAVYAPLLALQTSGFIYIAALSISHSIFNKGRAGNGAGGRARGVEEEAHYHDRGMDGRRGGDRERGKKGREEGVVEVADGMRYYRFVLGGILALLMFGVLMAYIGYASSVYPLEKARGYIAVAVTSNSPATMLEYVLEVEQLIPEHGNPVWVFPTPRTDFGMMHKSIDEIKERLRIISTLPRDGEAFNTGMSDVRGQLAQIEENIREAVPYVYVSFQNVMLSAIWITVILAIFTLMKRGKARMERLEDVESERRFGSSSGN
ncbi:MAG: glycosyltransferase [Candidatus Nitrosocaldus sp.]|nr:glycosyltransferase [Candidatus Nitrosocaldus sp.]